MDAFGFPRFERESELPPDGSPVWYYPGATTTGGQDGIILRLFSRSGVSRLCMVAGMPAPDALFEMPDGNHLYVGEKLLSYDDPKAQPELGVWPVTGLAWAADRQVVVFHDYTSAVAYGKQGRLWETDRLVLDGLKIRKITATTIEFSGDGYYDVEGHHLSIDLHTGRVVEGTPFVW